MGHITLTEIEPVRAFDGVAHRLAVTRQIGREAILVLNAAFFGFFFVFFLINLPKILGR